MRDLHDLPILVSELRVAWMILRQAAAGLHDTETEAACIAAFRQAVRQPDWTKTRTEHAAPQALTVVADPSEDLTACRVSGATWSRLVWILPATGRQLPGERVG